MAADVTGSPLPCHGFVKGVSHAGLMKVNHSERSPGRFRPSTKSVAPDSAWLPERLDGWIGRDQLVALVLDAVSGVDRVRLQEAGWEACPLRPETMLTLLVFCYAAGLHGSEAIEQAANEDAAVGYLCLKARPSADDLRRFRRRHRPLIKEVLTQVVEMAWQTRRWLAHRGLEAAGLPAVTSPPFAARDLAPPFAEVAERWIEQAVLVDSVARDL